MKAYIKNIKSFIEDRIITLEELKVLKPVFRGGLFLREERNRIIIHFGYDIDLAFNYHERKRVNAVLKKLKYRLLKSYYVLNGYYEAYLSPRNEVVEVLYTLEQVPRKYNKYFKIDQAPKEWVYVNDKIFIANLSNTVQFLRLIKEGQINPVCFHEFLRKSPYRFYIMNKLSLSRRRFRTPIIYASLAIVFIANMVKNPVWGLGVISYIVLNLRRLKLVY